MHVTFRFPPEPLNSPAHRRPVTREPLHQPEPIRCAALQDCAVQSMNRGGESPGVAEVAARPTTDQMPEGCRSERLAGHRVRRCEQASINA